jgi:hypothetical protein
MNDEPEPEEDEIPDTRLRKDINTEGRLVRAYLVTCWYGGHDYLCLPGSRASAEEELIHTGWGQVESGRWVCPDVMKSGKREEQ